MPKPTPRIDSTALICDGAHILGDVVIGTQSSIWYNAVIRSDDEPVRIGSRTSVQDNATIHVSPGFGATVGDDVTIGHGAIVHGCTIEDRVIVGMGAIVMNGAHVGHDSIIGAGAVVTQGTEVPAGSIVIGSPGRVLREASEKDRELIRTNAAHYVDLAKREAERRA
jgi:carbonic anhydrase/acetyltransferase-like protein (isoleucine patch superfamily)